jgi:4-hydroxy-tetrahydrodipicolinate reductase
MKIAILGYGKMGKEIEQQAQLRSHEIVEKVNSTNIEEWYKNPSKADVVIEFSNPKSAKQNLINCIEKGIPVVVGTTGWYDDFDEIASICKEKNGSLLYATNFSIGVNIFFEINKKLAELIAPYNDYEVLVEETHHIHKKDQPSGTAITLAEGILEYLPAKKQWVNKHATKKEDLSVISYRIDEVPGTHQITYSSEIDTITIKHEAHNRKGFALGAVVAAEWILNKKGIFTMQDVLTQS